MQQEGIVYLLGENGDSELYKIGVTKGDIKTRLKKLQTGNGNKIYCVASFESKRPYKLESMLHNYFKEDREEGEWFLLNESQVKEFLPMCKRYESIIEALKENPFF